MAKALLAASWLLLLLLLHVCSAQKSGAGGGDIVAETCVRVAHVLQGSPFELPAAAENSSCEIVDGNQDTAVRAWTVIDAQYIIYEPGNYSISCNGSLSQGQITVVAARFSIALCRGCDGGRAYQLQVRDAVQWSFAQLGTNCSTVVVISEEGEEITSVEDDNFYQFKKPGTFTLQCEEDPSIKALVVVTNATSSAPPPPPPSRYLPLIYSHAAAMGVAFGILFPIGAFLAYNNVRVVNWVIYPIAMLLAVAGFVLTIVYVELTDKAHFKYLIHGVFGLAVLLLALFAMPLLIIAKRSRKWHWRTGHIVAFFGMANILLGLAVLPAPFGAAITLCVLYGVWLVVAIAFYIFFPRSVEGQTKKQRTDSEVSGINRSFEMVNRDGSFSYTNGEMLPKPSTNSTRGPQALTKNVISEDKMVQLRKKSMDFLEAHRHREQLDRELGLHACNDRPSDLGLDSDGVSFMVGGRRDSKPDKDYSPNLNDSRAPLFQSTTELEDPFTPESTLDSRAKTLNHSENTDSSDVESDCDSCKENEVNERPYLIGPQPASVSRAHTFNYGEDLPRLAEDREETESRGGSLRITRHSTRARGKIGDVFSSSSGLAISSVGAAPPPPTINVSEEPPPTEAVDGPPLHIANQLVSASSTRERRRKAAYVAAEPPSQDQTHLQPQEACPFHKANSAPDMLAGRRKRSITPLNILAKRGASPQRGASPHSREEEGASPRPKKKVSVAQIEATIFPQTPISLEPPQPSSLARSESFSRTQHDGLAENALRSVMRMSQDAIVCANNTQEIVFWSAGAVKMFGYTPGEAIGSSLEMIIPMSYKERHRKGISTRSDETLKYIKKHSYAPEEQKHARLYAVHGVAKNGHEFPAEVNVTSFVIDGELFYTGVISELSRHRPRGNSISSGSDPDSSVKQRALSVGAQMKIAHKLRSVEHISRRELERVIAGSFEAAKFEADEVQMQQLIDGIMKAGDPDETGQIPFVNLIELLAKHRLYISESGLIASYGNTKGSERRNLSFRQKLSNKLQQFFFTEFSSLAWVLVYLLLNGLLLLIGVLATDRQGWKRWAYGSGPVLSLNCVLVVLPTLSSLLHGMRNSAWMNKVFPLKHSKAFHMVVAMGIVFWTVVHLVTHFVSFAVDDRNATLGVSGHEHFRRNISANISPTITGFIVITVFTIMGVSSIRAIRKQLRFIPFFVIHWIGTALFYTLLVIHGVNHYNPSFWKWLLPIAVLVMAERVYRIFGSGRREVTLVSVSKYDAASRTGVVELEKPKGFRFEAGQYLLLNLPSVGKFNWQACHISSGPKDDKLTVYIPYSDGAWFSQALAEIKARPYKQTEKSSDKETEEELATIQQTQAPQRVTVRISGPYGPDSSLLFDYKIAALVCGGSGPHSSKAILKKFLELRKGASCGCGYQATLTKLYFVWAAPSGNDFEWFTDYLSELCEDEHIHRYLDIRVFLTNIDSPPDQMASALLQLGLKTAGPSCIVRRPSQPQLNLFSNTSYGIPDFDGLLDYIYTQNAAVMKSETEFGVFTVGELEHSMRRAISSACKSSSKGRQLSFKQHHIAT